VKAAIPATIEKIETKARYARITIDTQENLTTDQLAELFTLHEKVGWFFFLPDNQKPTDQVALPEIRLEDGEKSPSQRLRAVLFIYWQQKGSKDDFELRAWSKNEQAMFHYDWETESKAGVPVLANYEVIGNIYENPELTV
jgi:hypothetical protein